MIARRELDVIFLILFKTGATGSNWEVFIELILVSEEVVVVCTVQVPNTTLYISYN